MATRQIEAKLILTAADRTGQAFKAVSGRLRHVDARAKAFNRQGRKTAQTAIAVGRAAAVVGVAVAAVGVGAYKKFAGDERTLTRIGITAEATREQMADIRNELFEVGDAVGLQFEDMVMGLDALTASGRTLEESMALLPSVAATAQASGAEMVDIATTADALFVSLNIGAKDMQGAFDILVEGGKAGKFELKDMAQFLPSLAPAFKALGYEGEEGLKKLIVALQTVREQTGSSSEAATAFTDVIMKMESQTINNNFKKFGVDLRGSLAKAREEGEDIVQAFKRISEVTVNGDLSKLPQLFTDKQMLIGMRALITGADGAERYVKAVNNADGAAMKALNIIMQDQQAIIDGLASSWNKATTSFGAYIAPMLGGALDATTNFFEKDQAIQRGMEKDGVGFFEKLYLQARHGQDSPEANRWAEMGGFKFDTFTGGSRKGKNQTVDGTNFQMPVKAPVPTRAPMAGGGRFGGDQVPLSRTDGSRYIPPHQRRVGGNKVISGFDDQIKQSGNALSNFDDNGNFIKPSKNVQLAADLDTANADQALDQFSAKAEQPIVINLDTTAAEAKIGNLEKRIRNIGSGSSRNRGQSMPGAM